MFSMRARRLCKIFSHQIFNYVLCVLFTKAEKQTFKKWFSIIEIGFAFTDTVLFWLHVCYYNLESHQHSTQTMPGTSRKHWTFVFGWPGNRVEIEETPQLFNCSTVSTHRHTILCLLTCPYIHLSLLCVLPFSMDHWRVTVIIFTPSFTIMYDSQTFCYGLNVWVAHRFICWSPNPRCDGIWRRACGW